MSNLYITGDCHGDFYKLSKYFSDKNKDDFVIITGDIGCNYFYGTKKEWVDKKKKEWLNNIGPKFICIRGNHDYNQEKIPSYKEYGMFDSVVYIEEDYPNIIFVKNGEIYNINGKSFLFFGGAYSVDKYYRIENNMLWFDDEQPNEKEKSNCLKNIKEKEYYVDYVVTHTCPLKCEPTHVFLPMIVQSTVDTSTEAFLDCVNASLKYKEWYCGHFHTDEYFSGINFLYRKVLKIK